MRVIHGFLVAMCLAAACAAQEHRPIHRKLHLELLVFDGCPNSPKMRANLLAALKSQGLPTQFDTVDLCKLPKGDPRLGYGAPTILLNGVDLFGRKKPQANVSLSCRLYPGGVPSAKVIAEKLR